MTREAVLVHLGAGVGNIVFATPLLVALEEMGFTADVALHADYAQTAELLRPWSAVRCVHLLHAREPLPVHDDHRWVLPAVPPFYLNRLAFAYRGVNRLAVRPPASLFYRDEQRYYLELAVRLGYPADRRPTIRLPIAPATGSAVGPSTLVIAPGCKTGEMAFKRWPHFASLAQRFGDVAVVGTGDDMGVSDGQPFRFGEHVRSFVDRLTLRETAELMAAAGAVVANDSGLAHVAAALGVPTIILFGPTPHDSLGPFTPNVDVVRASLPCQPCWFGERYRACAGRLPCLGDLSVDRVEAALRGVLPVPPDRPVEALQIVSAAPSAETRAAARADQRGEYRPLVSCIMPTTSERRAWVPQAIAYFLRQDYDPCELVIVDDGPESVRDLVPVDARVRYEHLGTRRPLGVKRNAACELTRGELIAHWDDDDWIAPHRLSAQVAALEDRGDAVCGLSRLLFYDVLRRRAWEYAWDAPVRPWVAGGTMCYARRVWERHPFPPCREGEDTRFVWALRGVPVLPIEDISLYVACVHGANTSRKQTSGSRWHPREVSAVRQVVGADWTFYEMKAS